MIEFDISPRLDERTEAMARSLPRPRRAAGARLIFALHRWTGLAAGGLLLVVGLTGAILVFAEEIDHALFPHLHRVAPVRGPVAYDGIYRALWRSHPTARSIRIRRFPATPHRSLGATLEGAENGSSRLQYLYLDPGTGRELGRRVWPPSFAENPMGWLLRLHYTLWAGKLGECLVAILSILLVISTVTGFVTYRRFVWRVLTLRVRVRLGDWRSASSDLHRVVGVWAWLFNDPAFYRSSGPAPSKQAPIAMSIDDLLAIVGERVPRFTPLGFRTEARADGGIEVEMFGDDRDRSILHGEYASRVRLDGQSGAVLQVALVSQGDVGRKLGAMVAPVHFGNFGGLPVKVVYVLGGLTPPLLSITGFALWWRRRSARARTDGP